MPRTTLLERIQNRIVELEYELQESVRNFEYLMEQGQIDKAESPAMKCAMLRFSISELYKLVE